MAEEMNSSAMLSNVQPKSAVAYFAASMMVLRPSSKVAGYQPF